MLNRQEQHTQTASRTESGQHGLEREARDAIRVASSHSDRWAACSVGNRIKQWFTILQESERNMRGDW